MAILGINAYIDRSSAVSISATQSISALCEQHSRAFPHDAVDTLRNAHDSWDTVVTHQLASNVVRSGLPRGTKLECVDYCEALSMATIASTDWSSCAILLSDCFYTRLGYYVDGSFYWIREFTYPNNIALFYASVSRFLGYNLLEDKMRWLAQSGDTTYSKWISSNAISISDGSYQLLHNLEQGFGAGIPDANIAASAQSVFTAVLVNLAQWLRKHVDIPRLAIVGRSAADYITNTAIANLTSYENVAAIAINGGAATALGAAALIKRPILEHSYVGTPKSYNQTPDQVAASLLQGDLVAYRAEQEFSDNSFINNNMLSLAFKPRLHVIKHKPYYVLCQDRDYASYFGNKHVPYFGQYNSVVKNKQVIDQDFARVIAVSKNKNPFINRVLEITRASGYPVIVSTPINEI